MAYSAYSLNRWFSLAWRAARCYATGRPLCVSFEVTHSCNARCRHCHLGGAVEETRATPESYGRRSRELSPLVVQISGGEPLLRPDLEEIVDAVAVPDRAPVVVVTTNAALLTAERYHRLRDIGVDEFSVSLDYPDDRHDDFRGIPGLFRRIERVIADIGPDRRRAITLCCVVQRDNFRSLERLAELALDWGVKLNFSTYTPLRTDDVDYMVPPDDLEELRHAIERIRTLNRRHSFTFTREHVFQNMVRFFRDGRIPDCRAGRRFFNVNPDGTLSPCGLVIKSFASPRDLREQFSRTNSCERCYTSIRANTEKPLPVLFAEHVLPP